MPSEDKVTEWDFKFFRLCFPLLPSEFYKRILFLYLWDIKGTYLKIYKIHGNQFLHN